jgi:hypothetical protein
MKGSPDLTPDGRLDQKESTDEQGSHMIHGSSRRNLKARLSFHRLQRASMIKKVSYITRRFEIP